MLDIGEGMLIGSSASSLVLVHGETVESEFVPTSIQSKRRCSYLTF